VFVSVTKYVSLSLFCLSYVIIRPLVTALKSRSRFKDNIQYSLPKRDYLCLNGTSTHLEKLSTPWTRWGLIVDGYAFTVAVHVQANERWVPYFVQAMREAARKTAISGEESVIQGTIIQWAHASWRQLDNYPNFRLMKVLVEVITAFLGLALSSHQLEGGIRSRSSTSFLASTNRRPNLTALISMWRW